jgi:hypothetical protein
MHRVYLAASSYPATLLHAENIERNLPRLLIEWIDIPITGQGPFQLDLRRSGSVPVPMHVEPLDAWA